MCWTDTQSDRRTYFTGILSHRKTLFVLWQQHACCSNKSTTTVTQLILMIMSNRVAVTVQPLHLYWVQLTRCCSALLKSVHRQKMRIISDSYWLESMLSVPLSALMFRRQEKYLCHPAPKPALIIPNCSLVQSCNNSRNEDQLNTMMYACF